jgi:hypothetical protein
MQEKDMEARLFKKVVPYALKSKCLE